VRALSRPSRSPRPPAPGPADAGPHKPPPDKADGAPAPAAPPPPSPHRAPPALAPGRAPGVDRRTAERLRRGQLAIEARLDLHGMTRAEAHRALTGFLATAQESGRRVVLVITGKGQGVLKDAVPRWLNEGATRARILLFAHAQPKHGGNGALYVLLKRLR